MLKKPFLPVEVTKENLSYRVKTVGREYIFGANSLPASVTSLGKELLGAPMRLVGIEDGSEIVWDTNYPDNESESFIQKRSNEGVTLCGALQSELFIVNTCINVSYDGSADLELKVMPRGKTVRQEVGLDALKPRDYKLEKLWLEIPVNEEIAKLYSMYPASSLHLSDGSNTKVGAASTSGAVPSLDAAFSFKPLLWLGDDDLGFGFYAENEQNWQPEDKERAVELVHTSEGLVMRFHLLDSHPVSWKGDLKNGHFLFYPLTFKMGFIATPVKPFPKSPYLHKALHIDCFIKIKGNYIDFLEKEDRFDRLVEKGVDTLILHEKWNKSQNRFELSEYTGYQIRRIVEECHKRGIKVLTYFGYEISTMSNEWSEKADFVRNDKNGGFVRAWYRVPYQRAFMSCYRSYDYADEMVAGIAKVMDEYHTDGVYLDGTSTIWQCSSPEHGCGWYDEEGNLHGSYPIKAVRRLLSKLHDAVSERGGIVNVHACGCPNFTALPYVDLSWYGENLQLDYVKGEFGNGVPLDYFRAEYTGRNMGVPVEFIAYENKPYWSFENAMAFSSIHGILPRPNDIEHPLDLMSDIWKIVDSFPVDKSDWCPYWSNGVKYSDDRVKVSYYRYTSPIGEKMMLAFLANASTEKVSGVTFTLPEDVSLVRDLERNEDITGPIDLDKFEYRILFIK